MASGDKLLKLTMCRLATKALQRPSATSQRPDIDEPDDHVVETTPRRSRFTASHLSLLSGLMAGQKAGLSDLMFEAEDAEPKYLRRPSGGEETSVSQLFELE